MQPIIKIENLSKMYRLGVIGTGTLTHDLKRWYYRVRRWEDPYLKIGETNVRDTAGDSKYVWALKDINLEVIPGEVLGIIGTNGAGKSTLLKILSKVTGPTTGSINYNGRIGSLLEVGTGFHRELTGKENIFLNGAILGMTKAEIRGKIDEIIAFSGVERYIDTPVKRYSSGMMVRLGFAVAAHLEPEILVVDEVLAVGDAEFQKKAIGKMQDVSRNDGRTVLFVSHNMVAVQNLCHRAIVLSNGLKVFEDDTERSVQYYIKTTRENISGAKLVDRKDRQGEGRLQFLNWTSGIERKTDGSLIPQAANTGKTYSIDFDIYLKEDLNNLVFSIGLFNKNEFFYTACRSDCISKVYSLKRGNNKISISFDRFPLTQGEYLFNIIAYQGTVLQDWISNAGLLSVEAGDYYGTGILPSSGKQGVLINYNWD